MCPCTCGSGKVWCARSTHWFDAAARSIHTRWIVSYFMLISRSGFFVVLQMSLKLSTHAAQTWHWPTGHDFNFPWRRTTISCSYIDKKLAVGLTHSRLLIVLNLFFVWSSAILCILLDVHDIAKLNQPQGLHTGPFCNLLRRAITFGYINSSMLKKKKLV